MFISYKEGRIQPCKRFSIPFVCLAVYTATSWVNNGIMFDALGAVPLYPESNTSSLCWTSVSWDCLREKCKRIPEKQARSIHPNLFVRLEAIK